MANENEKELDERDDEGSEDLEDSAENETASVAEDEEGSDSSNDDFEQEDEERIAAREKAELEREERELAKGDGEEFAPLSGMMGVERWVQFSFLAAGLVTFFVADRLISFVWLQFAEPPANTVTIMSAFLGVLVGGLAYRHPTSNQWVNDVVGELAKVTWPTREETYYSTVVVIVTSVIAALYTGAFDAVWSKLTDWVYGVS